MKKALCICNMCGALLIDENPQVDAMEYELTGAEQEMEYHYDREDGSYYGCPNCHTDGYLTDNLTSEAHLGLYNHMKHNCEATYAN
jgi:hypothetical protein